MAKDKTFKKIVEWRGLDNIFNLLLGLFFILSFMGLMIFTGSDLVKDERTISGGIFLMLSFVSNVLGGLYLAIIGLQRIERKVYYKEVKFNLKKER